MKKSMLALLIFRKAFDSVWHDGLLNKLLQLNVGGCFYSLIKSLFPTLHAQSKLAKTKLSPFNTQEVYAKPVF